MPKPWIVTNDFSGECRRHANGANKLVWTVMVAACGVIFIGFMTWMTSLNSKVEAMVQTDQRREGQVSKLLQSMEDADGRFGALNVRLDRMEDKIDRLLDVRLPSKR